MDEYLLPLSETESNYSIQHGLRCYIRSDAFHIHSKHDFCRILLDEQNRKPTLFHRKKYLKKRSKHSQDPMYHPQNTKAKCRIDM